MNRLSLDLRVRIVGALAEGIRSVERLGFSAWKKESVLRPLADVGDAYHDQNVTYL